jgi:hypothetical protein
MFLHTKEDTRMPCRAVTTWSSPYTSDDHFSTMPTTGLYGAGTVFASPLQSNYPMMSIGLSPGTFGVHLYQKPDVLPRFQTTSLESASSPEVSLLVKMSVSTSSVYGLAPVRLPTSSFLSTADLSQIGYGDDELSGVLCVVTMTSKGDICSFITRIQGMFQKERAARGPSSWNLCSASTNHHHQPTLCSGALERHPE